MASWLWVAASLVMVGFLGVSSAAEESCAPCSLAEEVLKNCNSSLQMSTWPGKFTYQPLPVQAPCACNKNFYDQVETCVACQSSDTAKLQVLPLADYTAVCASMGQGFPAFYSPVKTTSTVGPAPTSSSLPSTAHPGSGSASHSSLSPGAVAGIVVSVIALMVALSVAGYVFMRRREIAKEKEREEVYKYQERTDSYGETALPQYTGIQSSLPTLPQLTNLRVMNPDNDVDEERNIGSDSKPGHANGLDAPRQTPPGWRRGSFDDD
ncbi:hypothetical protein BGX34_009409 [Mortierella sp. NVP85]|nr:hypothetical protein BGX34_009409 [Mortierella sp. NVP85]